MITDGHSNPPRSSGYIWSNSLYPRCGLWNMSDYDGSLENASSYCCAVNGSMQFSIYCRFLHFR